MLHTNMNRRGWTLTEHKIWKTAQNNNTNPPFSNQLTLLYSLTHELLCMLFGIIAIPPCRANAIVRTLEHVTYDVRDCIIINIVVFCYYFCCGCSIGISARLQFALWIKRLQIGTKNKQTQTNYTHHPWVQQWWAYINSRTMALFERWHDEWYVCSTTWRTMVDCCI